MKLIVDSIEEHLHRICQNECCRTFSEKYTQNQNQNEKQTDPKHLFPFRIEF